MKFVKMITITVMALFLCLVPASLMEAATVNLDKIDATVNMQDDWTMIDTNMSDDEIMDITNLSRSAVERIRRQWESYGTATIEYDIFNKQQADIIINTVEATDISYEEANDLPDSLKEKIVDNITSSLQRQGAIITNVEKLTVGGNYSWKFCMNLNGTDAYEYQTLHDGKYITFSINSADSPLDTEKMNFLTNFMNNISFVDADEMEDEAEEKIGDEIEEEIEKGIEDALEDAFDDDKVAENSKSDSAKKMVTIGLVAGAVFGALIFIAGMIVLIVILTKNKNKKKQVPPTSNDNDLL